jgi:hypothetical protein
MCLWSSTCNYSESAALQKDIAETFQLKDLGIENKQKIVVASNTHRIRDSLLGSNFGPITGYPNGGNFVTEGECCDITLK